VVCTKKAEIYNINKRQYKLLFIIKFNFRSMETILEQQRRYHEERERLQDAMVQEMMHTKKTVMYVYQ